MDECNKYEYRTLFQFFWLILDTHFFSPQEFAVHAHLHLISACFKVHVTRKRALFGPV